MCVVLSWICSYDYTLFFLSYNRCCVSFTHCAQRVDPLARLFVRGKRQSQRTSQHGNGRVTLHRLKAPLHLVDSSGEDVTREHGQSETSDGERDDVGRRDTLGRRSVVAREGEEKSDNERKKNRDERPLQEGVGEGGVRENGEVGKRNVERGGVGAREPGVGSEGLWRDVIGSDGPATGSANVWRDLDAPCLGTERRCKRGTRPQ